MAPPHPNATRCQFCIGMIIAHRRGCGKSCSFDLFIWPVHLTCSSGLFINTAFG
jgi:hypothetical protein